MDRKAKNSWIIFLGIYGLTQYSFALVENSTVEEASVAVEEEVLSRNAIDDVTTGSEAALNEPLRDPFWPVGYWPGVVVIPEVDGGNTAEPEVDNSAGVDWIGLSPEEQALIKTKMRIGGILTLSHGCIAIINDQLLKEGDTLLIDADNRKYEFLVKTLTTERVLLESLSR